MKSFSHKQYSLVAAPLLVALVVGAGCSTTQGSKSLSKSGSDPSWTDKLAAPFKSGDNKIGAMENRHATANDSDLLSMKHKPNKKDPELIVAVAQMSERAGKFEEAEKQYQKALKIAPKYVPGLVGYAHLQDRQNKLEAATKLYQQAIAADPKEAAVHNDLGLCYHRRGMLPDAAKSLNTAVQMAPERKLYRNNLATVLVEQGQHDQALAHLNAAHGPAAAHYNLGYLQSKKGDNVRALLNFQQAAAYDPTMTAARQWVAKLAPPAAAEPALNGPSLMQPTQPEVARRYDYATPPQPARSPQYLQTSPPPTDGRYDGASTGLRYPAMQTGYTNAAVPPTP